MFKKIAIWYLKKTLNGRITTAIVITSDDCTYANRLMIQEYI